MEIINELLYSGANQISISLSAPPVNQRFEDSEDGIMLAGAAVFSRQDSFG
ncbi:MAG: hypothetical protein WC780_02020 [Lentimicrobiaceae bacterium]|jgi:hypothetical protein